VNFSELLDLVFLSCKAACGVTKDVGSERKFSLAGHRSINIAFAQVARCE